ncbi:tyrosine-type recombinase/integrase [Arthrobacter sp. L77]|uniref:tyrosine-type recombinase/integrase n=1 Tax=Arthrobacter sp. L77 TaxID=1496689 RepID=UPI0018CCA268
MLSVGPQGGRVRDKLFWCHRWVLAVRRAQADGPGTTPRIHDLRHTRASWLIQDGQSLFSVSTRLGHCSTDTTECIYRHLMPDGLQGAAHASQRALQDLPLVTAAGSK